MVAVNECAAAGQGRPMQTWLGLTLLALCTAAGIAVALAVALHKPALPPVAGAAGPKVVSSRWVISGPDNSNSTDTIPPPAPTPVIAPYRDTIAQQVGQLEDTLQQ